MNSSEDDRITTSRSSATSTPGSTRGDVLCLHALGDSSRAMHTHHVAVSYSDSFSRKAIRKTLIGKKFSFKAQGKFQDLVFTRTFSAFDSHNEAAANTPFRGFYTLFWLAVSLFMFKTALYNWSRYGNPLGTNDIMRSMFCRDGESEYNSLTPILVHPPWSNVYACSFHPLAV